MRSKMRLSLGIGVIIFLFGVFFTYFCMAKPCKPNNLEIEKKRIAKSIDCTDWRKPRCNAGEKGESEEGSVRPEFYLSEITDFYEIVIIILSTSIFIILGLVFFYSMRISKSQADEMVMEAIRKKTFDDRLSNMIDERFIESKNKGDIADILEDLVGFGERLEFLEEQSTIKSYEDPSDEGPSDEGPSDEGPSDEDTSDEVTNEAS